MVCKTLVKDIIINNIFILYPKTIKFIHKEYNYNQKIQTFTNQSVFT